MNSTKIIIVPILVLFLLVSCNDKEDYSPLEGTKWRVVEFTNEETGTMHPIDLDCENCFTLSFAPEGYLTGRTLSNSIYGIYMLKEKDIKIKIKEITLVLGPHIEYEDLFLALLDEVYSYTLTAEKLKLFFAKDEYMLLERVE